MPRSLVARSLEPLAAILWGVFILWSLWLSAVWVIGIDATWLRLPANISGWHRDAAVLVEDPPLPPNADLRHAVLILANHAEIIWLALAVANLHLVISATNGLSTARAWLGFTAGGAFFLGVLNGIWGLPFGWMRHGSPLGPQLIGVAVGWPLLWAVLVMSARESVLRMHPRASHAIVALGTAALVLITLANLHPIATNSRVWWAWYDGDIRRPASAPGWIWIAGAIVPWLMAFAMREKSVVAGASPRSVRAVFVLIFLNAAAIATHIAHRLK